MTFHLHRFVVVDAWYSPDYRSRPLVTIKKRCRCGRYRFRHLPGTLPNPTWGRNSMPRVLPCGVRKCELMVCPRCSRAISRHSERMAGR